MNSLPLYSRGRPLKNLIADWKKETGNNTILVQSSYWENPTMEKPQEGLMDNNHLYEYAVNFWYFSEIGFEA